MKLHLLHGPALASSRLKLDLLKKNYAAESVVHLSSDAPIKEILGDIKTLPMFSEERVIILENPSEDLIISDENSDAIILILWFDHEVSEKKDILKSVRALRGEIVFFAEEKDLSIFPILDLLANRDKRAFIELFRLKKSSVDIQYLITMVFYLLRSLILPNKNAPDFVKRKIARQKQNFSDIEIVSLYKNILDIDFRIKSGVLEPSMAEFLLVNNFVNFSRH